MRQTWGRRCLGVLLAGAVAAGWASGQEALPETATVTVIGRSGLQGDIARDEAIRDALRNAVEQAAGVFINAQSQTENFRLVKDVILSRARGFVTEYTILREGRTGEGVYEVEVKAVVKTKPVADSWLEMRALLVEKGMPRAMVSISETVDGRHTDRNTTQTRVENLLLAYGIPLVNQELVKENDRRDLEAARLADDLNKVAAISGRYKADLAILGKSRATLTFSRPIYNILTHMYSGDVELRGIRTANARLLFSDSAAESFGDRNQTEAARQALDRAGAHVAQKFVVGLMDQWIKELSKQVGTDYDLEVSNITFAQVAGLVKELTANAKLVTHCNLKDFRNGVAFIVVGSTTTTTNLALWMQTELKSVALEVTDVTPGAIKAKAAAKEE